MINVKYIEWINNYINIIDEAGLPVDYLTSINKNGEFSIDKYGECKYTGKIIGEGLVAIGHSERCGLDGWDDVIVKTELIVRNIDGCNFLASTRVDLTDENYDKKLKANELKIKSLYSHYDVIIEALNNKAPFTFIQDEFKLDYFSATRAWQKTK